MSHFTSTSWTTEFKMTVQESLLLLYFWNPMTEHSRSIQLSRNSVCLYEKSMLRCNGKTFLILMAPSCFYLLITTRLSPHVMFSYFFKKTVVPAEFLAPPFSLSSSSRPAVSSLLIGAFLFLARHCLKFLLAHWLGVALPCSKSKQCVKEKHLCVAKKSSQRTCAWLFSGFTRLHTVGRKRASEHGVCVRMSERMSVNISFFYN